MPFYLLKSSRLIAYSTPQAVQPMGSTSGSNRIRGVFYNIDIVGLPTWPKNEFFFETTFLDDKYALNS